MRLYDDVLRQMQALLPPAATKRSPYRAKQCAPEGEKDALLFRADTAYELGGSGKQSAQAVLFADFPGQESGTLLYGPDLDEISADVPFGHITIVRLKGTDDAALTSEQLKTIAFTVFQLYPKGYHIRISPISCREQVRVAKTALQGPMPLSFLQIGNSLIRAFLLHPDVAAVKTVFITDPGFDYKALSALCGKAKQITDAVQSTLGLSELDCSTCSMKPVCDEIDGLRELHLKREGLTMEGNN